MWGPQPFSARRLGSLIGSIPPESAFGVEMGIYTPGWSTTDELVATSIELAHAHYAAFVKVNSKKGTAALKPLRIPRPEHVRGDALDDDEREKTPGGKRLATAEEIAAFFGGNVRYTPAGDTPPAPAGQRRDAAGHYTTLDGRPCSRCARVPGQPMADRLPLSP